MFKFYMAHCLNETICRYKLNQDKRRQIYKLKDHLVDAKKLLLDHSFTTATPEGSLIDLKDF